MSLADYIIVAVVVLAAVGALVYARRHPDCGCGSGCTSCQKACARRREVSSDKDFPSQPNL
ncbi:MAG TPA: hypothetical protein DEP43_05215 [Ruminococcaceae bacterium]|nr:hypothetical protein [Oscillospiraceae bacterium]